MEELLLGANDFQQRFKEQHPVKLMLDGYQDLVLSYQKPVCVFYFSSVLFD